MAWYRSGENVTHYCGGSTAKEKENKPKGTQTDMTLWFHPTKVEDQVVTCLACGATAAPQDTGIVEMGD